MQLEGLPYALHAARLARTRERGYVMGGSEAGNSTSLDAADLEFLDHLVRKAIEARVPFAKPATALASVDSRPRRGSKRATIIFKP
jgi:hypothetical protein